MPTVRDRIRSRIRAGRYVLTSHAIEEMASDGLTEDDLEGALLSGQIVRRQTDRVRRRKYTIEGHTPAGRQVRVVCRFSDAGAEIVVITVYGLGED